MQAKEDYQDYIFTELGGAYYLVKNIKAAGDSGYLREYNTFIGTTLITLWVYITDSSMNLQADSLVVPWRYINERI
jgi:hypothetical protein